MTNWERLNKFIIHIRPQHIEEFNTNVTNQWIITFILKNQMKRRVQCQQWQGVFRLWKRVHGVAYVNFEWTLINKNMPLWVLICTNINKQHHFDCYNICRIYQTHNHKLVLGTSYEEVSVKVYTVRNTTVSHTSQWPICPLFCLSINSTEGIYPRTQQRAVCFSDSDHEKHD